MQQLGQMESSPTPSLPAVEDLCLPGAEKTWMALQWRFYQRIWWCFIMKNGELTIRYGGLSIEYGDLTDLTINIW